MSLPRYLISILPLTTCVLGFTSEDASLIAWRAYGDIIKKYITANEPLTPGVDFIYVTPPTSSFVRGGTPCPDSVTNYELWNMADPLQNSTNPLLGTDGPSYVQSLETYLQSVAVVNKELTPEQKKTLAGLEKAVTDAKAKFQKERSAAFKAWREDEVAQYFNQSFQSWIPDNDPQYANFQKQMLTADANYNNYMLSIYGSKYTLLQEQRNNINGKAQIELSNVDGYNMITYPAAGTYAVKIQPFEKHEITDYVAYKPAYTLLGYEDVCDTFFTGASGTTTLKYNFKNVDGHDWSTLGYQQTIKRYGGGFWGILGYKQSASSQVTQFNSWSSSFAQDVSVTLTMKGAPVLVPINSGFWDVGNVRKTYPTLRAGETDGLSGQVRLTHVLVAYQLGMQIQYSNAETWRNVTQFIEQGKKSKSGGLNIHGFSFGAGGSGAYSYSFNDLKTSTTADGGILSIPPTPEGMVFMLGARGKAL